ncbi:uncharacterized protein LOC117103028 [Anneissia japonica]|uniref:uncharacterized protein LOC117103028 n=1 Tax=Anneissia japonica TaxID=1529436 RepID=UPI00142589DA|nr:uncharacterized protein LOC117103028 [Anneissia japonica]
MDVCSLYTNIPHNEGVTACERFLTDYHSELPAKDICKIIDFILKHNYFSFNGSYYLQTTGTAMGTKMAPCYANVFMAELENDLLSSLVFKSSHYSRYIDDIFFIWEQGKDKLIDFISIINNYHHSIKFTVEYSSESIPFLDVLVGRNGGNISTSIYYKPTDNHQYLDFYSYHPITLKRSIVYSQCLRLKRICSDPTDYQQQLSRLTTNFLNCHYPLKLILSAILKASSKSRSDLLSYTHRPIPDTRIPMVFDHCPPIKSLGNSIKNDYKTLQEDPNISELYLHPPILAQRQPPNLKSLLTSSSLPLANPTHGNMACNNRRCQLCTIIDTSDRFRVPGTNIIIHPPPLNCHASNAVYIIYCAICNKGNYVGETGCKLRLRNNNHKKSVRDKLKGFS